MRGEQGVAEEVPSSEVELGDVLPSERIVRAISEGVGIDAAPRPQGVPTGRWGKVHQWCVSPKGWKPLIALVDGEPRAGSFIELECSAGGDYAQVLALSLRNDFLPDNTPLPVRIIGAPGCFADIPHDITIPLSPERHRVRINLPPNARSVYGRVFFQLVVVAPDANQAGVLTSRPRQLDIGEPR